jgi:NAD-dependent DNA ligase
MYNNSGFTIITDPEYDVLQEYLISGGGNRLVGSVETYGTRKEHMCPALRGSLSKVYALDETDELIGKSQSTLQEWIKSTEALYKSKTGKTIDLEACEVIVTCKFDGLSCVGYFDNEGTATFLSRGDTDTNLGVDISHIMNLLPKKLTNPEGFTNCAIQYEIMMRNSDLALLNEEYGLTYKQSRSMVSSILSSEDGDNRYKYLVPVPLRIVFNGEDSPTIPGRHVREYPTLKCLLMDTDKIRLFAYENALYNDLRMDGCVISLTDKDICRVLGREGDINKYEVAFKFTAEKGYSTVVNIIYSISAFGIITPIVQINPISLKGNTITNICIANKLRYDEMNLHYGDMVRVIYDIIPYVDLDPTCKDYNKNTKGDIIPYPTTCPTCGELLRINDTITECENDNCPSRKRGRVYTYISRLGVKDVGLKTIELLFDNGIIDDIPDLYRIVGKRKIRAIKGFGDLKLKKLLTAIKSIETVNDCSFYDALGVRGLSKVTFKTIFHAYPHAQFQKDYEDKEWKKMKSILMAIKGIGSEKADILVKGLRKNRKLIERLLKCVVIRETNESNSISKGDVVFTKIRDLELEEYLTSLGYTISDSLTKGTRYLIVPSVNESSNKIIKAKKYGIDIVPIAEAREVII